MRTFARMTALATCALAVAVAAGAADFTFRVPVELHRIPADIRTLMVNVVVYDSTLDPEHSSTGENQRVGAGFSAPIPIVGGEFTDTVTVLLNAAYDQGRRPEEAYYYDVYLLLQGPPGYEGGCATAMRLDGAYPHDPARPVRCSYFGRIDEPAPVQVRRKAVLPADVLKRVRK